MTDDLPRTTAAGVVLFVRGDDDAPRFLLLRNAVHETWGFPKGHAEGDEGALETARRELEEETGVTEFTPVDGVEDVITYDVTTRSGRVRKTVTYFLGEVPTTAFRRSPEHDDHRWATADEARALIEHDNLRGVLERAAARCRRPPDR